MDIHLIFDASCASAPRAFRTAMNFAAHELGGVIQGGGRINIAVGWGEVGGAIMPTGAVAEGGPARTFTIPFDSMITDMMHQGGSNAALDAAIYAPTSMWTTPQPAAMVSSAQLKAWGVIPQDSQIDGVVGFSNVQPFSYATNHVITAGKYDLVGAAEHEIGHALGRFAGDGALNLTHYTAPGVLSATIGDGYFSLDGGRTAIRAYAPAWLDGSDWAYGTAADSFDAVSYPGQGQPLTAADRWEIGSLGYQVTLPGIFPAASAILSEDSDPNVVWLNVKHPQKMSFAHG